MKKKVGILALILLGVCAGRATVRPRYEILDVQVENYVQRTRVDLIETWHDRESGVEFVCVMRYSGGLSCIPTGRSWK